jgi:hypothetical protein
MRITTFDLMHWPGWDIQSVLSGWDDEAAFLLFSCEWGLETGRSAFLRRNTRMHGLQALRLLFTMLHPLYGVVDIDRPT